MQEPKKLHDIYVHILQHLHDTLHPEAEIAEHGAHPERGIPSEYPADEPESKEAAKLETEADEEYEAEHESKESKAEEKAEHKKGGSEYGEEDEDLKYTPKPKKKDKIRKFKGNY